MYIERGNLPRQLFSHDEAFDFNALSLLYDGLDKKEAHLLEKGSRYPARVGVEDPGAGGDRRFFETSVYEGGNAHPRKLLERVEELDAVCGLELPERCRSAIAFGYERQALGQSVAELFDFIRVGRPGLDLGPQLAGHAAHAGNFCRDRIWPRRLRACSSVQ